MTEERQTESSEGLSKPRPGPWEFAFTGAAALVAMVVIVVLLSIYEGQPVIRVRSASFCCPDVLDSLFSAVNTSIDPCRNIFGHTCYALVTTRGDHPQPADLNTHPIDGFPKSEAGRAIAAYYRACILSLKDNVSVGRASAAAIGSVVNPPPNASISSYGLLALIMDLSLRYGLPSVIEFSLGIGPGSQPYLNILPSTLVSPAENISESLLGRIKSDALATVNEDLPFDVNTQEVDEIFKELTMLTAERSEKYELDSVAEFTPDVSSAEWKELLGQYNVTERYNIFGTSKLMLKDLFHAIFSPERRQVAVVSTLVEASVKLASVALINASSSEAKTHTCRTRSQELTPLWILDRIQGLTVYSQGIAINRTYGIVARTVLQKSRSGMKASDFQELEKILSGIRLLLPSDIVPPGLTIPVMTSAYAHAELVTRAYMVQARRHQMFTGTNSDFLLEDLQKNYATIAETVMTVPASVYSLIPLNEYSETVLLMSTVGVYMADSLWQFVFDRNWSAATNAALKTYRECVVKNSRSIIEWPSRLLWLSVQTSLEASQDAEWDAVVYTGGARNVTRGQLFYLLFVRYLMCQAPHSKYTTFGQDVNAFISGFGDFYRSFQCTATALKVTAYTCSLHM